MIEVTRDNQPRLFQLIGEVADEMGAPFPQHIYLSPDASVGIFFDSSFWSLFHSVKINLQIGLGLVNTLSIVEIKGLLAHEFAHFSRKNSCSVNYIYRANYIIFNMLYDNAGHNRTVDAWTGARGIFLIFARLSARIIRIVQWIVQRFYGLVNLPYMHLSREMEIHADALAAIAVGTNNLKTALLRQVPAELCYAKLLEFYDLWLNENINTDTIYPQHRELLKRFAVTNNIKMVNDEMIIDGAESLIITRYRVNIEDQWAAHLTLVDRLNHLMSVKCDKAGDHSPAWGLLVDQAMLERKATSNLYESIAFTGEPNLIDFQGFYKRIDAYFDASTFDPRFKGYYDTYDGTIFIPNAENAYALDRIAPDSLPVSDRNAPDSLLKSDQNTLDSSPISDPNSTDSMPISDQNTPDDLSASEQNVPDVLPTLDSLLSNENLLLSKRKAGLVVDSRLLNAIMNKRYRVKTFEFDGKKYLLRKAGAILKIVDDEKTTVTNAQSELDKEIFRFFYHKAFIKNEEQTLLDAYERYFTHLSICWKDTQFITEVFDAIDFYADEDFTYSKAMALSGTIKQKEQEVKKRIASIIEDSSIQYKITNETIDTFNDFLKEDLPYFDNGVFNDQAFDLLIETLNIIQALATDWKSKEKKKLLNYLSTVLDNE